MDLQGNNGYRISYSESGPPDCRTVIVAMHGFAGDKTSSCIRMLEKRANKMGLGLIKFNWPAHGDSETDGLHFTVDNCLSDLDSIIGYVKEKHPGCELVAFATSFGGYLALLYHYHHPGVFRHLILRSPAIRMSEVLDKHLLTEEMKAELRERRCIEYGFERMITVTDRLIDQIRANDVFRLYENSDLANVSIIHGTKDDVVPVSDSIEFAKLHGCSFYPVEGADHRYKKIGELDAVIDIAAHILETVSATG